MKESVRVSVKVEAEVPRTHAEYIASEFAEWLENQGYSLLPNNSGDERDYAELARDFIEEWG